MKCDYCGKQLKIEDQYVAEYNHNAYNSLTVEYYHIANGKHFLDSCYARHMIGAHLNEDVVLDVPRTYNGKYSFYRTDGAFIPQKFVGGKGMVDDTDDTGGPFPQHFVKGEGWRYKEKCMDVIG